MEKICEFKQCNFIYTIINIEIDTNMTGVNYEMFSIIKNKRTLFSIVSFM